MAELGADAPAAHAELGSVAARLAIPEVVAVGPEARGICSGVEDVSAAPTRCRAVPDVAEAVALLRDELRPGDVVLVKASRAASLERVAAALVEDGLRKEETVGGGGAA
jgi:UDP-N-acetylmuramoyl-tripeptide--D-alanyl-D-alanine ligase